MRKLCAALTLSVMVVALQVLVAGPAAAACHNAVFVDDPYTRGEGGGTVTITVSNQAGQPPGGTVDYETVNGTAKAGQDYSARSGTLNFPPGTEQVSFTVPITNDSTDEPNETFKVALSNPTGCFIGGSLDPPATVTITDNDPKPQPPAPSTPTRSSAPTRRAAATPSPTPTPTKTATPSPTLSSTPTSTPTRTAVAVADEDGGGLSGGALAGIVLGVAALGGAATILVRRRFLT